MKNKILIASIALFLLGCSNRIPDDKLDYIGMWSGKDMMIDIHPDKKFRYSRKKSDNSNIRMNGSLKDFDGNDFNAGFLVFSTTFKVSSPPHKVNNSWKMTVDGVELTKVEIYKY